jgi:antitoxin Phd
MRTWQLQEAKARLSEVIKQASREGPQTITMRGEPTAVVISQNEYERLKQPRGGLLILCGDRHCMAWILTWNESRH